MTKRINSRRARHCGPGRRGGGVRLEVLEQRRLLAGGKSLVFTAPSGNGSDAMVLRLNKTKLEIVDNGQVVASQSLSGTSSVVITGANNENDSLTVDYSFGGFFSISGGISFSGGTSGFDQLAIVGTGSTSGSDTPSKTTLGSGSFSVNGSAISYSGLEASSVSAMVSMSFVTPNSADVLSVTSPAAQQNQISGTSGGISLLPLAFSAVPSFVIDTAANDGTAPNDSVTVSSSGLVASGLQNFTVNTGAGNDALIVNSPSLALPVAGGSFTFNGGSGTDQIAASADVGYSLSNTTLASTGGGSVALTSVEAATLTGGPSANTFSVSGWSGSASLDAGNGSDTYNVTFQGAGSGSVTVNDSGSLGSDSLTVNGTASADSIGISATQVTLGSESVTYAGLESLAVNALGGDDAIAITGLTPSTATIVDGGPGNDTASLNFAGAFAGNLTLPNVETTSVAVAGDFSGSLTDNPAGTISTVVIHGSMTATGAISAQAIGSVAIDHDLAGTLTGKIVLASDGSDVPGTGAIGTISVGGSFLSTGRIFAKDIQSITIVGDWSGQMDVHGSEGDVGSIDVGGSLTGDGSMDVNGDITTVDITGDANGTLSATGSGSIQDVTIGGSVGATGTIISESITDALHIVGNLGGSITGLIEHNPDGSDVVGTGALEHVTVDGTVFKGSSIAAKHLGALVVGHDFGGSLKVHGSEGDVGSIDVGGSLTGDGTVDVNGDITTVDITGDANGTLSATGSGSIQNVTIGGSVGTTGTIISESITGSLHVVGNVSGSITGLIEHNPDGSDIDGTGALENVSIDGTVLKGASIGAKHIGSLKVGHDFGGSLNVHGSEGDVGSIDVGGSLTGDGTVDVIGDITTVDITGDANGTLSATGSGSIQNVTIGGSVGATGIIVSESIPGLLHVVGDLGGSITGLIEHNPDGSDITGTGALENVAVDGAVLKGANIAAKHIGSLKVGHDFAGSMHVHGSEGDVGSIDVGGSLTGDGTVDVNGDITTVDITGDANGTLSATGSGSIQDVMIGGNVGSTGQVITETIGDLLHVGGDVNGQLIGLLESIGGVPVAGTGALNHVEIGGSLTPLGSIRGQSASTIHIGGGAPGLISVGTLGSLWSKGGTGSLLLNLVEGGVTRQIKAALDNTGGAPPASAVSFVVFYDSNTPTPQAAVRVVNADPADNPIDLSFTSSTTDRFDVARIDSLSPTGAATVSGVHDIAVYGNLLSTISPATQSFFGLTTAAGGVQLPLDHLGSVGVRDNAASASILAADVQAVAFSTVTEGSSNISAAAAGQADARALLAPATGVAQANGAFAAPVDALGSVALFLVTGPGGNFDGKKVLLADQFADGNSVVGLVTATPVGSSSFVSTIGLLGDGGSIQTQQLVTGSITSTGPLGDVVLSASQGMVANVTAPSVFGNIVSQSGPISGTIQTTGLRIDPSTGAVTAVAADLGRLLTDSTGHVIGTTTVQASGGGLTGRIISRGNLVSTIDLNGGVSGVIAAQGDLGAILRDASGHAIVDSSGHLTRFGGLDVGGGVGGQVVVLGNIFGDINANGIPSGRIAVKGAPVAGLTPDRIGILGNVNINGNIDSGAAIISGGKIGDLAGGTTLNVNNIKGILAAKGDINFGQVGNTSAGFIFENATGVDAAAIDAIFTDGGQPLAFDMVGLDLAGLGLILTDVAALHVGPDGHLTGTKP